MTIVGVDLSTYAIHLAWLEEGKPQRWHQELGKPKDDLIDRLRRIRVQWPGGRSIHGAHSSGSEPAFEFSPGHDVTEVCIEYPRGQNHQTTASLAAVAGIITRQAPTWSRVAWIDSRDLRTAIGSANKKGEAHAMLMGVLGSCAAHDCMNWNEHELDALVTCIGWTKILAAQDAA